MIIGLNTSIKTKAKLPHNLFMLNLALFHLLMTPAVIALNVGIMGMLLPLLLSLSVMLYTCLQSRARDRHAHWFIHAHWQLACRRYRLLLISYALTLLLLCLGWLLSLSANDPNMTLILQTVFIRISIMPVLIVVMVNFYLESSAISLATNGEIPDQFVQELSPDKNSED